VDSFGSDGKAMYVSLKSLSCCSCERPLGVDLSCKLKLVFSSGEWVTCQNIYDNMVATVVCSNADNLTSNDIYRKERSVFTAGN
jgi:hypothetical protein